MKPTLNEEIGMSQQGIDYVNSLEVKDPIKLRPEFPKDRIEKQLKTVNYIYALKRYLFPLLNKKSSILLYNDLPEPPRLKPRIIKENEVPKIPAFEIDYDTAMKAIKNNIPEEMEKQRIRKQARNAWICVFVIIAITVILNWK